MTKQQKIEALILECNKLKIKADKWDALEEKIASFYVDENGNDLDDDEGGDLLDIGEATLQAFGWA